MAAGTGTASGHGGRGSSAAFQSSLDRRFQGVSNTMESIQGLSNWCIENKKYHSLIVRYWMKWLRKSAASHRLNLFYLANDVIQNCKRKNAIVYRTSFAEVLPEATLLVKDAKVRKSVERILTIWEERNVYPEEFISELRAGLTKKATPPAPVNPKAALKSKIVAEFVPQAFIEQLSMFRRSMEEAELKEKQLAALRVDVCSTEALKRLKDKAGGKKFSKDFEEGSGKLQDFVNFLDRQVKGGPPLLEALNNADVFYEMQYKEVKIIANAYKTFANRVTHLKRKLDTLKSTLPGPEDSPIPSPSEDAPSPTGSESPFHGMTDARVDGAESGVALGDVPSPIPSPAGSPRQTLQHGERDNRDVEDMELSEEEESESANIIVEERVEQPAPIVVPKPTTAESQPLLAQEVNPVKQAPPPATPAAPLPVNLANVDLGKISSILSSLTSVMKNTGVSPVSRTSPDTPTTPSSHSSAVKPSSTPGGGTSATNPLASILSRVDITPEGILSALSKTQGHSGGLQGISNLLHNVAGNTSSGTVNASRDSTQNSTSAPPHGHNSPLPQSNSTVSAAPGEKGTTMPPALKHTPPLGNSYKQELERKGGREQGKEPQPTPSVSSSPSTLESKIHKFLQGNPGFRAFNLGLPGLGEGQGSSSNSPSLAMENLDGTPVRDEAVGTPTQDEMMDQPGPEPALLVSNVHGPAGGMPSQNGSIRALANVDSSSMGQKNQQSFSVSESGDFVRSRSGGGHGLSPTAYRSDPWAEGTPPQNVRNNAEYRPVMPQDASKEGYGAVGTGNPPYRREDFYDGRSKGAAGRGPTAGEQYPLHPLSAAVHLKNARDGDAEDGGREGEAGKEVASGSAPAVTKPEAPHYRHIETLVSTSSCGEGAPIEILGYSNRRLSGERIQTVESVRTMGRGQRPHPRGAEAGVRPGPAGGGWYGESYVEGATSGPPPPGMSESMNQPPHTRQPGAQFPFEDRGHMPYPSQIPNPLPSPHPHIPPSNFFSSPPPPIPPPPPPPIPQLPPPPQDFLSPPSAVMVGGVLVQASRPDVEERPCTGSGAANPNPPSKPPPSMGRDPPLFNDLPHHGTNKDHFPPRQGPPPHRSGASGAPPSLLGRVREGPSPPPSSFGPPSPPLQQSQHPPASPPSHTTNHRRPSSPMSLLHQPHPGHRPQLRPPHLQPQPHMPPHSQRQLLCGPRPHLRPPHPAPFDREPPFRGGKRPGPPFGGAPRAGFGGNPFHPPKRPFLPPRY